MNIRANCLAVVVLFLVTLGHTNVVLATTPEALCAKAVAKKLAAFESKIMQVAITTNQGKISIGSLADAAIRNQDEFSRQIELILLKNRAKGVSCPFDEAGDTPGEVAVFLVAQTYIRLRNLLAPFLPM